MNSYVRKRDKLLSVVNRLHVEELIALEEINSTHNKDYLKNVVCPLLLEDDKITNTIEVEPGNGAKISCRGYLLRQKRYEGSSSCDSCGHIVFKLFPISETETQQPNSKDKCLKMKVCKTCLNEHSGHQFIGKKIQKKEIPSLTEYLPNGMTSARASNSWHFIRKDICAYKSSKRPFTQKMSCLSDLSDLSEEEIEPFPMHVKNNLISVLRKPATIDGNILKNDPNSILFPSFVDDIPILISPHIKEDTNLDFVKTVVNNMLFDIIEHVICIAEKNRNDNLPYDIFTELLKNIESKINIVIDNNAVNILAVDSPSIFPFKSDYRVIEGVKCEKKKKVIHNKIETIPYAGVCSLVTPISHQKGHFIYNASRSCLYNRQGLVMKNEQIPSYLQPKIEKTENHSYRTRKRTLDVFLDKKMEDGCAWKSLLPEGLNKLEVKESQDDILDENHNGFDKKNVFSTELNRVPPLEISSSSCVCVTCKKVYNSKASVNLTNGPKTLGKFSKIDASVCEECNHKNPPEALKKKNNIENSKNSTKWSIIPEIKQEIVAAKDLNPLKRKLPNATPSDRSEMKLKPPEIKQEAVDLTKQSNVNVKLIRNPSTRVLEEIVAKSNGKYLILQSSSTSLTNDCTHSSSNGLTGSDIVINGKSYKIDTEFKLNDLLKDNEAAHKFGTSQKAFLAQLPGILQRSLNEKKVSVQNKVVSIASSQIESIKRNVYTTSVNQNIASTVSQSTPKDSNVSQASTTVRLPAPSFSSKSISSCRPSTTYISIKPAPEKILSSAPEKKLNACAVTINAKSSIGSKCLSFTPTVNPNSSKQNIVSTCKSTSTVNIPINQSCKLSSLATAFQLKPAQVKSDQKVKLLSASQVLRIKHFSPSADSLNIVDKLTQANPNSAEKTVVKSLLSGPKLIKTPLSVAEQNSSSDQAL